MPQQASKQNNTYRIYGLTLQVNRYLPNLISASPDLPIDVKVDLMSGEKSQIPSPDVEFVSSGLTVVTQADVPHYQLWFRGDGQLNFEIDALGTDISVTWDRSVLEEVTGLLVGPVLACVLRLRGRLCLHACVVAMGKQAIAIVGDTGAGKSTTAAALVSQGYPMLADDVAVLDNLSQSWHVHPGYPRLRLWPETIQAVYGSEADLTRVFSFSEKRFVELTPSDSPELNKTAWNFYPHPLPLSAIYVLDTMNQDQLTAAVPTIDPISPATAVMLLMRHRSAGQLMNADAEQQAREFAAMSSVVRDVPVRKVKLSHNLQALSQLCDAIVEDVRLSAV